MDPSLVRAARDGDQDALVTFVRWMIGVLTDYFSQCGLVERDKLIRGTLAQVVEDLPEAPDDPDELREWLLAYAVVEVHQPPVERQYQAFRRLLTGQRLYCPSGSGLLDGSIIRAAQAGEVEARNALGRWLAGLLMDFFSPCSLVERDEQLQNTVKDVVAKLDQAPHDPDRFRGWVLSFAVIESRRARARAKRKHMHDVELQRVPVASPQRPDGGVLDEERRALLYECVERLPKIYEDAVRHHLAGGDHASLAERENIPEGTARRRLSVGRARVIELYRQARLTRTTFRTPPS